MHRTERLISRPGAVEAFVAAGTAALGFANGGYGNVAVAIVAIATWVVAGLVAWSRPAPLTRASSITVACLAGLFALSLLSMAWADDAGRAFIAAARVGGYLGMLVLAVLAIPQTGARRWLAGVAIGLGIVVGAGLATRLDPSLFGGGDQSLDATFPNANGRLSYPIGYWNGLAAIGALGIVLLTWLSDAAAPRRRALAPALMPAYWLTIYLTSSRGGIAAALFGVALIVWLGRRRLPRGLGAVLGALGGAALIGAAHGSASFLAGDGSTDARHYGALMAIATVAVGALVAFVRLRTDGWAERPRTRPHVDRRLAIAVAAVTAVVALIVIDPVSKYDEFQRPGFGASSFSPGQRSLLSASGTGRFQFWSTALGAWESSPAHGIGAGNYELYWNAHPGGEIVVKNAHSLYLETLAELGPVGLALLLGFLGSAPVLLFRRLRERDDDDLAVAFALVATGALSAAVDWTFQLPAAFAPVVLGAAVLCCAGATASVTAPARRRALGRVGIVAVAWVAVGCGVVILLAEQALSASRDADRRGDLQAAVVDARRAASIEPFSPEPQIQLALVQAQAGNRGAANQAAAQATNLAPGDWRAWYAVFQIAAAQRDPAAAAAAATQLERTLPVPLGVAFRQLRGAG